MTGPAELDDVDVNLTGFCPAVSLTFAWGFAGALLSHRNGEMG